MLHIVFIQSRINVNLSEDNENGIPSNKYTYIGKLLVDVITASKYSIL